MIDNMKKFSFISLVALAVIGAASVSCSPSAFVMQMESRKPSESGLDLAGKSMSVVYLESPDGRDSLFNNRAADALAYALEGDYFDGAEAVKVYNLVKDANGDYSSTDTLLQYVLLLDSDVVMILDTPELSESVTGRSAPASSKLYVYDSMAGEDDGVTTLKSSATVSGLEDVSRAMNIGNALAKPLRSQWESEQFTVLYFDGLGRKWIDAAMKADDMKWDEAIDLWMDLARLKDRTQSSCARYNIALGCFMLGQYDLALEWLDSSDSILPLSLSKGLRKKILDKKEATS
jgi:tetratricopeptide (TPR) repeat protein